MQLPDRAIELLDEVLSLLEEEGHPAMIVGGIATFAWGDPRTTRDLDVATLAPDTEMAAIEEILVQAGFEPDGPFSTAWGPRFILPTDTGFPVDVFLDDREHLFDRRRRVEVDARRLWVKGPEDIVVEKLIGARDFPEERSRDIEDAVGILYKQAGDLDWAYLEERADEEGVLDELTQARTEVEDFEEETR